jgi:hypothetical protein
MGGRGMTTWGARAAALAGLGGLLFTVGCGASQTGVAAAQPLAAAQPSAAVVVGCEPNQRTLVRPTVVNGVAMSQVECVSASEIAISTQTLTAQPSAVPVNYTPGAPAAVARRGDLGDTRIIPASYPAAPVTTARPVRTRQVVYDDARPVRAEKPQRSVKKSAIIIGSTAGVGAGVGAAVGGKKGALIGAVIGGGGATLWDQITRRK